MANTSTGGKKKVVKYIGTADVREIDAAAWKQAGVEGQGKVVWSKEKGWELPASDFNADALRYCDERDEGLVVTEVDA